MITAMLVHFKVLSWNLAGGSDENCEKRSSHVLTDIKPSTSTQKSEALHPGITCMVMDCKKKNSRRRKRRRMGTQNPVRIVSCPHVKLCIL
jgi:hypothetical protein